LIGAVKPAEQPDMSDRSDEQGLTAGAARRMAQFYLHRASACREAAEAARTQESRQDWLTRMSEWLFLAERLSNLSPGGDGVR
jgi:hypothetical protein